VASVTATVSTSASLAATAAAAAGVPSTAASFAFRHSYASLGTNMYSSAAPQPVTKTVVATAAGRPDLIWSLWAGLRYQTRMEKASESVIPPSPEIKGFVSPLAPRMDSPET
jgi:hypothetical protein